MRIKFQKLGRAKKAARALAALTHGVKLSTAQLAVARIAGFRDWHDLAENHVEDSTVTPGSTQDDLYSATRARSSALVLATVLGLPFGEALHVVVHMKLPGLRIRDVQIYESLWLQLLQQTYPVQGDKLSPGTVVKIKSETQWLTGKRGIIKKSGRSTHLVTDHSEDTCVADFEAILPRRPLPLFVPSRLKLAYGYWTEPDGARVLFSRDYKPLWRLTSGKRPERLQPWLWIEKVDQQWFWDDTNPPWNASRRQEEEQRLAGFGITALPKLADTLPDLLFDPKINRIREAVDQMASREDSEVIDTFAGKIRRSSA